VDRVWQTGPVELIRKFGGTFFRNGFEQLFLGLACALDVGLLRNISRCTSMMRTKGSSYCHAPVSLRWSTVIFFFVDEFGVGGNSVL